MTRALLPGRWNRDSSRPVPGCTGACSQGRETCDCELAAWLPPDADRAITPPPAPQDSRARDIFIAVVALALLAFGIGIYPH